MMMITTSAKMKAVSIKIIITAMTVVVKIGMNNNVVIALTVILN